TKDIREGFELTYAVDADDPACASDLSHFTNGWRACIMSQVRAPVAGEAVALRRDERLREAAANFLNAYRARYGGVYGQIKKHAPLQDQVLALVFASREAPPADDAAPQASEAVQSTEDMAQGLGDVVLPRLPPITHKWAALISDSMARSLENWARAYTRTAILADRQRQAMIPASRESGNSHTDGGAIYE
ncbi:hypothetical protein P3W66_01000, partial [Achromobacter denitrificans]|uniref:hypothetical protein n=1 Tax=Achromobacter denitrificans TaxID=32002 RepID=UPI0023E3B476